MTMSNKIPASCGLRRSVTMASALSAGLVLFFACCGISYGQEPSHLLTAPGLTAGGLAEGEMLLGELNCVGCHVTSNEVRGRIFAKQPPLLGDVGDRVTPNYLRDFLDNPQSQKPGTGMPRRRAAMMAPIATSSQVATSAVGRRSASPSRSTAAA